MATNSQPNFLFITTDQQRWDALGIHNPRIRTPAMDSIARDGIRFDRAYPTNAICAPARASMITGRSQRGHHVFNNVNLSEAIPVVGDSLREAGYTTALIGKPHFKSGEYEDALPDDPPSGAPVDPEDGLWYGPYFGFDHVEILGAHTCTPAMDSIARDGIRFDRAYPTNAICAPARASMITGRSQRGHHVFNNVNLSEAIPVVGDSLREAGYTTALIGKPHFKSGEYEDALPDDPPPGAPVDPEDGLWYGPYFGFDHVEILGAHTYPKGHWRVWLERHHPEGLELWKPVNALEPRSGAFHSWKNAIPAEWHYTHRTADRTVDWLRGHAHERPFFLWMSFYDPHQPFTPPRPYCDMYDPADMPPAVPREDVSNKPPQYQYARDGLPYQGYDTTSGWDGDHHREIVAHYYGMTTFIDDGIARVLAELDRLGLAENTHVIFSSDHGEGLNDHGIAAKPMMSYECVNRVPLLWRHPATVAAGRVHGGVMTQLDLVPTFIDLAGAPPLVGMEGRSFAPLLNGETDAHRDAVIVERIAIFGSGRPELVGTDKAHAAPIVQRVKMLVTEDWKLLHYGTTEYGELYNVKDDPEDLNNLWDDPAHADVRAQLVERLLIELINDEAGDPHLIMDKPLVAGSLRDARLMEPQPEARADLTQRLRDLLA